MVLCPWVTDSFPPQLQGMTKTGATQRAAMCAPYFLITWLLLEGKGAMAECDRSALPSYLAGDLLSYKAASVNISSTVVKIQLRVIFLSYMVYVWSCHIRIMPKSHLHRIEDTHQTQRL